MKLQIKKIWGGETLSPKIKFAPPKVSYWPITSFNVFYIDTSGRGRGDVQVAATAGQLPRSEAWIGTCQAHPHG